MDDTLIEGINKRMSLALCVVYDSFKGLRLGRASPDILRSIKVMSYGNKVSLNKIGIINVTNPQMLSINIWNKQMVPVVIKEIQDSDLGLNPIANENIILIPIPELTVERRNDLSRVAIKYAEQGRIAIRGLRRDGMAKIKNMEKKSILSKDQFYKLSKCIQELTDNYIQKINIALSKKEKDIKQV